MELSNPSLQDRFPAQRGQTSCAYPSGGGGGGVDWPLVHGRLKHTPPGRPPSCVASEQSTACQFWSTGAVLPGCCAALWDRLSETSTIATLWHRHSCSAVLSEGRGWSWESTAWNAGVSGLHRVPDKAVQATAPRLNPEATKAYGPAYTHPVEPVKNSKPGEDPF
eukprot:291794-Chlamydomonas_euryale.AAC.8